MVMAPVLEFESSPVISKKQRVLALRETDPSLPSVRIAETVGLTRERVRQILKEAGLPTYLPRHYGYCASCGNDIPRGRTLYCSLECRHAAVRVTFNCALCGTSKTLRRSAYNAQVRRGYKNMYCSVGCRQQGNWVFRDK